MHFNEQLPIRPQEVWDNTQERLILWTNLKNQMCLSVEKLQIFKKSVGLTLSWSSFIHFVAVILGRNGMKPHYRLEMSCCPKWRSSSSSRSKVGGVKTHSTFLHSALDRNSGQWMKERDIFRNKQRSSLWRVARLGVRSSVNEDLWVEVLLHWKDSVQLLLHLTRMSSRWGVSGMFKWK